MYQGDIFALLGHNGAGKTSTIKMITGLIEPSYGQMLFQDFDLLSQREKLYSRIGVCPQENILYNLLTVRDHFWLFDQIRNEKADQSTREEID